MNNKERVLEALGRAGPLTEGRLIEAAYRLHPEAFALAGASELMPDARKVWVTLCGARGMVGTGLVRRTGDVYALTEEGHRLANRLLDRKEAPLTAAERDTLTLLRVSAAYFFYCKGLESQITQDDLLTWFADPETLKTLASARDKLAEGAGRLTDGRPVTRRDADMLNECAEALGKKFNRRAS